MPAGPPSPEGDISWVARPNVLSTRLSLFKAKALVHLWCAKGKRHLFFLVFTMQWLVEFQTFAVALLRSSIAISSFKFSSVLKGVRELFLQVTVKWFKRVQTDDAGCAVDVPVGEWLASIQDCFSSSLVQPKHSAGTSRSPKLPLLSNR